MTADMGFVEGVAQYLGGDDQIVTVPAELLDRLAHDLLRLASSIGLGAVKEVDTAVVGSLHAGVGAL